MSDFIKKANTVHNNKYIYDKYSFINTMNQMNIYCDKHGWFSQRVSNHLQGRGCFKCKESNGEK